MWNLNSQGLLPGWTKCIHQFDKNGHFKCPCRFLMMAAVCARGLKFKSLLGHECCVSFTSYAANPKTIIITVSDIYKARDYFNTIFISKWTSWAKYVFHRQWNTWKNVSADIGTWCSTEPLPVSSSANIWYPSHFLSLRLRQ